MAAALALAGALVCACSPPGSMRLQGSWKGVAAEGVSGDGQAAAAAFATGTTIEVHGDQMTVTTPRDSQSGRYRVQREDATTLVVTTDKDGPEHPQTFVFTNRDETMRWAVHPGQTIVFARGK